MPPSVSVRLPAPAGTHNARPFFAYGLKRKEREEERDGSRREGAAFLLSLPSFARPSVRVHFGGYFWLPTAREQQNQLYGSARSLRVPQSNSGDRAAVSGCTARIHPPSNQLSLHPSILREREREREKRWVSCLRLRGKRENQLRRNRPSPSPSPPRPRTPAPSSFVMHSLSVKRRRREEGREGQEALRKKEGRKAAHSFGRRERERERERERGRKERAFALAPISVVVVASHGALARSFAVGNPVVVALSDERRTANGYGTGRRPRLRGWVGG